MKTANNEYIVKKRVSVYDEDFEMPEGEQIDVVYADDCANAILPNGQFFHASIDNIRVRVMKAKNEKDKGTWCEGNYGGRLFI